MEPIFEHSAITLFICANCARPAQVSSSSGRPRPTVPDFNWPGPVKQVIIPCTGRLQPEHVLKAFESGSSIVSVVACQEDNCHYIEGSRRCTRRVDYIRLLLNEIGLGDGRLLLFHLPGSASEDMMMSVGKSANPEILDSLSAQIAAVRDRAIEALRVHSPNPLHDSSSVDGDGNE
jgi:coenzyme F420-reducing hydrogenase delta subunit